MQSFDEFFEINYGKPVTPELQILKPIVLGIIEKWLVYEKNFGEKPSKVPPHIKLLTVKDRKEFPSGGYIAVDLNANKYISVNEQYVRDAIWCRNYLKGALQEVQNGAWEIHDWPEDKPWYDLTNEPIRQWSR